MRFRLAQALAVVLCLVLSACSTGSSGPASASQSSGPQTPAETMARPSPRVTPTPRPTQQPSPTPLAKPLFHVPRFLYEAEYELLHWTLEDLTLSDGTPAVAAHWPGGPATEGVIIAGPEDDVIGLKLVSSDGAKTADFLFKWSSTEVTQWVIDQLSNVAQTGVDQEVSKVFGVLTVDFKSTNGNLISVTLRPS